ncbi:hypothetical protein ACFO9Q_10065 [Paenibacillus sp. GCM10023252]
MRGLLISLLLLITVIIIYTSTAEGDAGTKKQLERAGNSMSDYIRGMSP